MSAWGAIIMGFFGAVFAALTMAMAFGVRGVPVAIPFLVFVGIALAAMRVLRMPGEGIVLSPRGAKAIRWSTIAEGVGLFVAANIVDNLGHPELLLPAMALVVGLHFLPIARAIPARHFTILGGALIAAALVGFALPAPKGAATAGCAAALALWIAAVAAIRRDRRAKLAEA